MEDNQYLLKQLIESTAGKISNQKAFGELHRVCASTITGQGSDGDKDIIHRIEKSICGKKGVKTATEFSKKYNQLVKLTTLQHPLQVMEFMHHVSSNNARSGIFNSSIKMSSTPYHAVSSMNDTSRNRTDIPPYITTPYSGGLPSSNHSLGLSQSATAVNSRSSGFASRSASNTMVGGSRTSLSQTPRNQPAALYQFKDLFKDDVDEQELIQDVLLVAQGIDGKLARYDHKAHAYKLPDNVRIKTHHRSLCSRLFEAGWLYNRIKQYMDSKSSDTTFGPIGQSFCVALHRELTNYHRLLAVIDGHLKADNTKKLTLDGLVSWFHEPIKNLRLLACLSDIAKAKKGGVLLSEIHSYTNQGDMNRKGLVSHILAMSTKPLFEVISRWIYAGELDDLYSEFFICSNPQVMNENIWHTKYSLRKPMIPSFISQDMAQKILLIGKSVVFLHKVCKDNSMVLDHEKIKRARVEEASSMFDKERQEEFHHMINTTYLEISKYLIDILLNKYHFVSHLKALRRYLLLGQGDFIKHLMELLVDELGKDASTLYMHNLNSVLETAASRAMCNQFEDKDTMERLDVRLLETSEGDLGWDVFSLDYRTSGPIATIFTQDTMIFYLRIFNFLWRAKRMEFILADVWQQKQHFSRLLKNIPEVTELMDSAHHIAAEMSFFIRQFSYYINVEVLHDLPYNQTYHTKRPQVIECLWVELLEQVYKAESLDYIIAAHQQFLDNMIKRCLIDESNKMVFSVLRAIFDLITRFQAILEEFFESAALEKNLRDDYNGKAKKRKRGAAAVTELIEDEELEEKARRLEFLQQKIKPCKNLLKVIGNSYQSKITNFLVMLASQADYTVQSLVMRLDFNDHYKQREPILSSPQALKKVAPPRRAPQLLGVSQPVGGLVGILGGRVSSNE